MKATEPSTHRPPNIDWAAIRWPQQMRNTILGRPGIMGDGHYYLLGFRRCPIRPGCTLWMGEAPHAFAWLEHRGDTVKLWEENSKGADGRWLF